MKRPLSLLLVLLVSLHSLTEATAQIRTRLMPPFPAEFGTPFYGTSVAINKTYVATGDPAFDGGTGTVRVFDSKTGATVRTFSGSLAGAAFGTAIAVRGTELIVGSPNAAAGKGLVSFFDIPSGRLLGVIQPGTPGFTPDYAGAFGFSIACDGELIVVGCPQAANGGLDRGMAVVIRRPIGSKGDSAFPTHYLLPSDPQNSANFGRSVAIYGSTIAVGAPNFDQPLLSDSGKVYLYNDVFVGVGGVFTEILSNSSGATAIGIGYGWSVALTPSHLIASSPFASGSLGSVWFVNHLYPARPAQVENGTNPLGLFGYSIAASESHVAIGSPGFTPGGALPSTGLVSVYQEPSDSTPFILFQEGILERPLVRSNSLTGQAVAITGSEVAAGSPGVGDVVTASFSSSTSDSANLIQIEKTSGESLPSSFSPQITGFTQAAVSGVGPFQSRTLSAVTTSYQDTPRSRPIRSQAFLVPYLGSLTYQPPGSLPPKPTAIVGNTGNYFGYSPIPTQFRAFVSGILTQSLLVEQNLPLSQVSLKSFSPPRHAQATAPGNEFFSFPAIYQTKSGGVPVSSASDSGITLFSPTGTEFLTLQEGTSAFPPTASLFGQFPGRLSHEFRNAVFPLTLPGSPPSSDSALGSYDTVANAYALVAREGDVAPDATPVSATFSSFLGENSDGFGSHKAVLFRASLRGAGVTAATNEGLWVYDTTLSPTPLLIAQKGIRISSIKGTPKITRFLRYGIDRLGAIMVLAQITGSGSFATNNVALIEFSLSPLSARILLQKGTPAPGTNGALIKAFPFIDGRTSGHWTVLTTLTSAPGRADATNDLALYTHQTSGRHDPVLALRKGSRFNRPGSEIIKSILLSAPVTDARSGALGIGLGHVIDIDRSVAAILTFTDGIQCLSTVNP